MDSLDGAAKRTFENPPKTEAAEEAALRRERITTAVNNQPQPTVTVLSSLLAVEDEVGYIPQEAIAEVANRTGASVNDVWAVASFYPNFRFTPPCERRLEICWGPSCHLSGAMPVIAAAHDALDLDGEGDTPDGRLSLRYNTCLAACAQAPVIAVDHHLMGRQTPESVRAAIAGLLAQSSGSDSDAR